MIEQALKFLTEQALKNQVPTVDKINPHAAMERRAGEGIDLHVAVPRTPHRYIRKLTDLTALLQRRVEAGKVDPTEGEACPPLVVPGDYDIKKSLPVHNVASEGPVCYVNDKQIDYVETPDDMRGLRVRMPLTKTPPLRYLEKSDWMDQEAFVRMLWIDFRGCFSTDALLKSVDNVNFTAGVTSAVGKQGDRASVSKEIKADAVGANKVPEEVAVQCDLFDEIDHKVLIQCAVEIDANSHQFRLVPFPSELVTAYHETYDAVAKRLSPIQTYHGEYDVTL